MININSQSFFRLLTFGKMDHRPNPRTSLRNLFRHGYAAIRRAAPSAIPLGVAASIPANMAYNRFRARNRNAPSMRLKKVTFKKVFKRKNRKFKPKRRFKKRRSFASKAIKMTSLKRFHYSSTRQLLADPGLTKFYGWDVGLGGRVVDLSTQTPNLRTIANKGGDIHSFFENQFLIDGSADSSVLQRKIEWTSSLHLTMRNQGNFGVFIKKYYVKVPLTTSVTSADTMQEILANFYASSQSSVDNQTTDLREIPGFTTLAKVTSSKVIKMMPGDTLSLKLKTSSGGAKDFFKTVYKTRNPYTRSLVLAISGFPLHDETNPTNIASGPFHIDVIGLHKFKGRVADQANKATLDASATGGGVTAARGQQFQYGRAEVFAT